jgi:hypothetical protein
MFSSLDKALVALVMGIIGIIGVVWKPLNISAETVASVIGILTPLLVYVWPNAPKDPPVA